MPRVILSPSINTGRHETSRRWYRARKQRERLVAGTRLDVAEFLNIPRSLPCDKRIDLRVSCVDEKHAAIQHMASNDVIEE